MVLSSQACAPLLLPRAAGAKPQLRAQHCPQLAGTEFPHL